MWLRPPLPSHTNQKQKVACSWAGREAAFIADDPPLCRENRMAVGVRIVRGCLKKGNARQSIQVFEARRGFVVRACMV